MTLLRLFVLCFIIAIAFIYGARFKSGIKWIMPGDINIEKQGMKVYIPIGSSLIIATILFIIFKNFIG